MKDIDIQQLIEVEQARRREADATHVRQLSREVGGEVGTWCSTWRHALRAAAMALLVLLPGAWLMILPQRVDDRQVLCNQRGEEQQVLNRACSVVGNCSSPLVSSALNGGGDNLKHR